MANKILKGVMTWLIKGQPIKDNIETEIAVPEDYFGATRQLDNLEIGGTDGQFLTKNGTGIALVNPPSGGQAGIQVWESGKAYSAAALVCKDDGEKVRYWQALQKNTGQDPETSSTDWKEVDFMGTFILPEKITVTLQEPTQEEKS